MSMLAERKRKQKYFIATHLKTNGKEWAEDTNKFGHKMLEKMGWSQGKGLGAKENGVTEPVRQAYKMDNKGMGYKGADDDQWTEHEKNFTALLDSLSGDTVKTPKLTVSKKSLEEKSKMSRARVHYQKFTRGKDVSRYSQKDLACIFGKKPTPTKEEKVEEKSVITENNLLISSGSMLDYFKQKIGKTNGISSGDVPKDEGKPNKKKCKKLNGKKLKSESDLGLSNPGFDPIQHLVVETHCLDIITEEDEINQEDNQVDAATSVAGDSLLDIVENPHEVVRKKGKKTKNSACQSEPTSPSPKKKKLKRKRRQSDVGVNNPGFNINENEEPGAKKPKKLIEETEAKPQKKSKKKKKQICVEEVEVKPKNKRENDMEVKVEKKKRKATTLEAMEETETKPKKKKKKRKEAGLVNPGFTESNLEESGDSPTNKPQKNKKKIVILQDILLNTTSTQAGLDNPGFIAETQTNSPTPQPDDMLFNIVSIPKPKQVRFNDITEERLITPNCPSSEAMQLFEINNQVIEENSNSNSNSSHQGLDNAGFDPLQEKLQGISDALDKFQADVENSLNEAKAVGLMVGEVGGADGENERLQDGSVKLRFKHARIGARIPHYMLKVTGPKKSYKHLIKGDIVVGFQGANLHEIEGYAYNKQDT